MEKERQLAKQLLKDGRKEWDFLNCFLLITFFNFSRALLLLKKKRYQENIIDQTLKHLSKIEQMVRNLQVILIQVSVLGSRPWIRRDPATCYWWSQTRKRSIEKYECVVRHWWDRQNHGRDERSCRVPRSTQNLVRCLRSSYFPGNCEYAIWSTVQYRRVRCWKRTRRTFSRRRSEWSRPYRRKTSQCTDSRYARNRAAER